MTTLQETMHEQFQETAAPGQWRGVFFDGPQPDTNAEGDEIPVWLVYVGDGEAEPVGTVYHLYTYTEARHLARRMSRDRRLELVDDATTA